MKRISLALLLCLALSLVVTGKAQAITVDGALGAGEWDTWFIRGFDPNEDPIDDDYDIDVVYSWWDNTDVYIRTDVFGIPTLAKLDSGNAFNAFYQWSIDTLNKDGIAEMYALLTLSNRLDGNDRIALYRASDDTLLGYGPAHIGDGSAGSIVEARFSGSLVPGDLDPVNDFDVGMFLRLDNAGDDPDDRLPDVTGYIYKVPEPSSMLLLGLGLAGILSGRAARKRFRA